MNFYQRGFCYLWRKKGKSVLLFFCFLVVSTLILCAAIILQTTESANRSIREKTGTKVILSDLRGRNGIPSETVSRLGVLTSS